MALHRRRLQRAAGVTVAALSVLATTVACNSAASTYAPQATYVVPQDQSGPGWGVQAALASSEDQPEQSPNVVLVVLDDLGYGDTAMATPQLPSRHPSSPVIDAMARTGVSFDRATASPNCAPTRASMLTGTHAPSPSNNIYTVKRLDRYPAQHLATTPTEGIGRHHRDAIPADATTWAEVLQEDGYRTGTVGKFHVTDGPRRITTQHGFDFNAGGTNAGFARSYRAHARDDERVFGAGVGGTLDPYAGDYTPEYVAENIVPFSQGVDEASLAGLAGDRKSVTDALGDAAIEFIRGTAAEGKPFALHFGSYAVHGPIGGGQARPDLAEKYGALPRHNSLDQRRRAYAALLENADQSVGRLLHSLDSTDDPRNPGHPLSDNTVVFVTSDNGGVSRYGADQLGLRNNKSSLWDGGVRVPWIAWSKNKALVPAGQVRHDLIDASDFYPTVLQAAGAKVPNPGVVEGVSWWDSVGDAGATARGDAARARVRSARVVHFPAYVNFSGARPGTSIRQGRWKLTYRYETGSWHLYDVLADPSETREMTGRRPDVAHRLGTTMVKWLTRKKAPVVRLAHRGVELHLTNFSGEVYSGAGRRRHLTNESLVVRAGEPLPLVLPDAPRRMALRGAPERIYPGGTKVRTAWTEVPAARWH